MFKNLCCVVSLIFLYVFNLYSNVLHLNFDQNLQNLGSYQSYEFIKWQNEESYLENETGATLHLDPVNNPTFVKSKGFAPIISNCDQIKIEFDFKAVQGSSRMRLLWLHLAYGVEIINNQLVFMLWTQESGVHFDIKANLDNLFDDEWHNVQVIYDSQAGEAKIYYDSELVKLKSGLSGKVGNAYNRELTIGSDHWGTYFYGEIDNLKIANQLYPDYAYSPNSIFVSTSGSDEGLGTIDSPYLTIDYALSQMDSQDDLYLREGGYYESIDMTLNGNAHNKVMISNFENESVTINGGLAILENSIENIENDDFIFENHPQKSLIKKVVLTNYNKLNGRLEMVDGRRFMKLAQLKNKTGDVYNKKVDFESLLSGDGEVSFIEHTLLEGVEDNYWGAIYNDTANNIALDFLTEVAHWSHLGNNNIFYREISTSNSNRVYLESNLTYPVKINLEDLSRTDGFNILNHPDHLDEPGEFIYAYHNEDLYIYFIPYVAQELSAIHVIDKAYGFKPMEITKGNHIHLKGLDFVNFGENANTRAGGVVYPATYNNSGIVIEGCSFVNLIGTAVGLYDSIDALVQFNNIKNIKDVRGIQSIRSLNAKIYNNVVDVTERTAIYTALSINTAIHNNRIGKQGIHGNGVSVYQGDLGALISHNEILTDNIPITLQGSGNITIIDNIAQTTSNKVIASWGSNFGDLNIFNNILLLESEKGLSIGISNSDQFLEARVVNNITSGGIYMNEGMRIYNIYTRFEWFEDERYGWSLGLGEFLESDQSLLFNDLENIDFSAPSNTPALNAGINVEIYLPHDRFPDLNLILSKNGIDRNLSSVDIGAYEQD